MVAYRLRNMLINESTFAKSKKEREEPAGIILYIEGKPGTGKTSQAHMLEASLISSGISAIDIDGARGFQESEKSSIAPLASYVLHYAKGMLKAVSVAETYDVAIVQHTPYFFAYALNTLLGYNGISIVQRTIGAPLGLMIKPMAVFYLYASEQVLLERFNATASRQGNIHNLLLRTDDSRFIEQLKHIYGSFGFFMVNAGRSKEAVSEELSMHVRILLRK